MPFPRWLGHPWRIAIACCVLAGGALRVQAQAGTTISIMPLGDSLTWGYDGGPDNPTYLDSLDTGGYRSPLYLALGAQGVSVNYVGASNGNPSPVLTAAGQTAQNGYNGYRIDDIENNLAASVPGSDAVSNSGGYWLTGGGGTGRGPATPNIIILQIGANDIEQGYDPLFTGTHGTETYQQLAADTTTRLQQLITQIMYYDPTAWIFTDGTSPLLNNSFVDDTASVYEYDTQQMIAQDFSNQHVIFVNMHNPIVDDGFFSLYEGDGIHLDSAGYTVMADAFEQSIIANYNFADAESVPEPSTCWLLIAGVLALLGWSRMKRGAWSV